MISDVAAQLLQDNQLGVPGTSLFINFVPDEVQQCVLVLDSLEPAIRDENLPGYMKKDFQVIVRDTSYNSALTIAKKAIDALNLHRVTVNGIYVIRMRASHDPIVFPVPDSDIVEVSVNMRAIFVQP